MNKILEKLEKDITIQIDTELRGIIIGNVKIDNSAKFYINGTIYGDLLINKNCKAIIRGIVSGTIINNGICEVYGIVNGTLLGNKTNYHIDVKAHINKI